jgi:predicted RNA binding protein YcfA (HicA-like mRNA interferase family)
MKLRDARTELRALGFVRRPGKGSHEIWTDPASPQRRVVLYGRDGEDIHHYQAVRVRKFKRGPVVDPQREEA